jgi:Domain of unknown function (DUF4276)
MGILSKTGRKIILLCEGDTEELAVREFVRRQWRADGFESVGLHTINLAGKPQSTGSYARFWLAEDEILAVFTLIDLHGTSVVRHGVCDPLQRKVQRVQDWLRDQLKDAPIDNFFPHVCVHQTEAWILAEGMALARRLGDPNIRPDVNAEQKDFENPPSSLINERFLRSRSRNRYGKIADGRPLFASMQFEPVYRSCLYFRAFYDDLRTVAIESLPSAERSSAWRRAKPTWSGD